MNEIIRKLASRKLWLAIAGVSGGIALSLGATSTEIETIVGAVMALISGVTYILVEGKIDAESVKTTIVEVQEAAETINKVGF